MDLYRSALSLTIHKLGFVEEADVDDVISRYRKKHSIVIDKDSYLHALEAALAHYNARPAYLFVCNEGACAQKAFLGADGPWSASLREKLPCPVEETGCHWKCEMAPVLTLKLGSQQINYPDCSSAETLDKAISDILNRSKIQTSTARE